MIDGLSTLGAEILSAQKRRHRTFSAAAVSESEVLRLNRKGWKSVARVLKDGAKKIQREFCLYINCITAVEHSSDRLMIC